MCILIILDYLVNRVGTGCVDILKGKVPCVLVRIRRPKKILKMKRRQNNPPNSA